MSNHQTKKPLGSLETNVLKHKQPSRGQNNVNKVNLMVSSSEALLTQGELSQYWVQYHGHEHPRNENNQPMNKQSQNISRNNDGNDKNCCTYKNSRSTHIKTPNIWNWGEATDIYRSHNNFNKKEPTIGNNTSDMNNFAQMLINRTLLQIEKSSILSSNELNNREFFTYNGFQMSNNGSEICEVNQDKSVNDQLNRDHYKENFDPNIVSDVQDNYQNNHNTNDNYNISHEKNIDQNIYQTVNSYQGCNNNKNRLVQALENGEYNNSDKLDTIHNDHNDEISSSINNSLEYMSL